MISKKGTFVVVICIFLIKWTIGENKENNRLKDALKNSTRSRNNDSNNGQNYDDEDDNILRIEAKKMLKQCGVDSNESQELDGFGNSNHKNKNSFNNNGENNFSNRRYNANNNNRNSNRQEDTEYGNSNNDGDWNMFGSQNRYKNNGQNEQDNSNYNSNKRGQSYNNNMRQQDTDQNYEGTRTQYSSSGARGQYDQNDESSQNDKYGLYNNYGSSSNRNSNSGNDYASYGSQSSNSPNGYDSQNSNNRNSYTGQNSGYGNNNYGQSTSRGGSDGNRRSQTQYGENRPQYSDRGYQSSNSNNKNSYSPYYGYDGGSDRNTGCDENSRGGLGYMNGGTFGLTRGQHRSRSKRNSYFSKDKNEQNDDNQCISQCVFGYLQLLDNDRTPSETMVIKWLQEHVKGNDMDRIKALRDARRCFARLTTSDTDDGCDFSKELASCLELDLE